MAYCFLAVLQLLFETLNCGCVCAHAHVYTQTIVTLFKNINRE